MEEMANDAISNFEEVINLDKKFVKQEHDLLGQLEELDYVIGHLDMTVEDEAFHIVSGEVSHLIIELKTLIGTEMNIISEEEKYKHIGNWRVVKKLEEKFVKFEIKELNDIKTVLNDAINAGRKYPHHIPHFDKLLQILEVYSHIFEEIIVKERQLL